jgi:hypothetical protein
MDAYAILQVQDGSMTKVGEYRLGDGDDEPTVRVDAPTDELADGIRGAAEQKQMVGSKPPDDVDAPASERYEDPSREFQIRQIEMFLGASGYHHAPLSDWENRPRRPDDDR